MADQVSKKRRRAWAGLTLFEDGLGGWLKVKGHISYRKALIALAILIALCTGANAPTVLNWLKSLLALLGN